MDLDTIGIVSWLMILPLVVLGTLLHVAYEWSGHSRFVAVFGAVNESYWEHIKIAVWPVALLHGVLFALGGHEIKSFIPAATAALYSLPISMIGLLFLCKSITKRSVLALDVGVFIVVIVLAQVIFVKVLRQLQPDPVSVWLAALYLAGLIVSFLRFSLKPPREPDVFVDPIAKEHGLAGHTHD